MRFVNFACMKYLQRGAINISILTNTQGLFFIKLEGKEY